MSVPFSRSLRSMHVDSFRASIIGMVLAVLLVFALIGWFFLAKVSVYEYSTNVVFQEDGHIYSTFDEDAMLRVRTGQTGTLHLDFGEDTGQISLPILIVGKEAEQNRVEILVMEGTVPPGAPTQEIPSQLEIEVEYISPIQLVMKASGQYFSGSSQRPPSP